MGSGPLSEGLLPALHHRWYCSHHVGPSLRLVFTLYQTHPGHLGTSSLSHARMPQHPVLPTRSLLSAFIKCLRNYEPALYKHKFLRSDWKQGRYLALPVSQMVITSARADNASSDALKLGFPTRLASLGTTNSTFVSVLPFLLCKASRHTFSGSSGIPASGTVQPANTEV